MPLRGEIFLALRYLKPQKSLLCLLTYISLLGPILGVAVLLVVMAAMNGMPAATISEMKHYNPHITMKLPKAAFADDLVEYIEKEHKLKASPVTTLKVFIQKGKDIFPSNARGVYPPKYTKFSDITDGRTLPQKADLNKILNTSGGIEYCLLSSSMRFDYKVGDKIIFHSPSKYKEALKSRVDGKFKRINMNSAKALIVAGFYHVRDRRLDEQFFIIHQDSANEMLSYDWGTATQIEITLDDPHQSKYLIDELKKDPKFAGFTFTPWQDQSKGIYKRIVQEKSQMYFVLFLIMGAAGIGIGASIFSLVIQKTKEIGVLKSIGTNPLSIIMIFISQGAFIGILGSLLGYLTGITIIKNTDSIIVFLGNMGAQMGQLRTIPMKLDNADVQFILWGAIGICLLAAIIPAIIAATVNPVKALQSGN